MRRNILLFCFFFFVSYLTAQVSFPTTNANWSVHVIESFLENRDTNIQYLVEGDTLIDEIIYHQIFTAAGSEGSPNNYVGAFREKDRQFLYIEKGDLQQKILYDFNIEIGTVIDSFNDCHPDSTDCIYLKLNRISTWRTDDGVKRLLYIFHKHQSETDSYGEFAFAWIEGIGSTAGLIINYDNFYTPHPPTSPVVVERLFCHWQGNEQIFFDDNLTSSCELNIYDTPYSPLVVENAHWKVGLQGFYGAHISEYLAREDTTINEKSYKKIYLRNFKFNDEPFPGYYDIPYQVVNEELYAFIREDSTERKVYAILLEEAFGDYCGESREVLLFDYGLNIGETLKSCIISDIEEGTRVVNIFEGEWFGQNRRVFDMFDAAILIEGIGSNTGLFESIYPIVSNGGYYFIYDYCVGTDEACNVLFTSNKNIFEEPIQIFPNPSHDFIQIKGLSANARVRIYDTNGQFWVESNEAKTDLRTLPKGLFFLEIVRQNQVIWRKKIIKL